MKVLVLQYNLKQLTIRILFRCENIYWGAPCASLFLLPVVLKNGSGAAHRLGGMLTCFNLPSFATAGNG